MLSTAIPSRETGASMFRPMPDLPDLRTWLADHAADGSTLSLNRPQVKAIFEELQRLRQSNDLLRKQNRKVRGKVSRLRGGAEDEVEAEEVSPRGDRALPED